VQHDPYGCLVFEALKEKVCNTPKMGFPNLRLPFEIKLMPRDMPWKQWCGNNMGLSPTI
jgi:hypothetical protein